MGGGGSAFEPFRGGGASAASRDAAAARDLSNASSWEAIFPVNAPHVSHVSYGGGGDSSTSSSAAAVRSTARSSAHGASLSATSPSARCTSA